MTSQLLKVEGAGNDFLLGTGAWADRLSRDSELVVRLCRRRRGIGADGALAITATGKDRLRLVYHNADGSPASFCGNGTRCAARAGVELLGLPRRLVVETAWTAVPAEIDGRMVRLELPAIQAPPQEVEISVADRSRRGWWLVVGVPHLVVPMDDVDELRLEVEGPPLRRHEIFGAAGVNVNFTTPGENGELLLRTYERGVERETLCCGSGVVAAAVVEMAAGGSRPMTVRARSGDPLVVEAPHGPQSGPIFLTGPTRFIACVEPTEDRFTEG